MSIAGRVWRWHALLGVAAIGIAAAGIHVLWSARAQQDRLEQAHRQLGAVIALKVSANGFSEQIAEFLLIGEAERADFLAAQAELETGLQRLEESRPGKIIELEDSHRLNRLRTVYGQISQAALQAVSLREAGRHEEAIHVFRRDIEDRLDAEFEALLTSAILDEEEEVRRAELASAELWPRLGRVLGAATLGALLLGVVGALLLARGLTRPVRLLTKGAETIARGRLDHRIRYDGRDELGALANRLNEMAAVQEEQRSLLLGARAELERQVAERTLELAAANRRLTELDRLRVRFLADIGHELRTPLTALRGEAEITLRHSPKPEEAYRDALERIVAHAAGMGRLVDDLLFLTRSEADNLRFEMRPAVLQDIVGGAMRDTQALQEAEDVPVVLQAPEGRIRIAADAQRLRQAMTILLTNAIAASPPGRPVTLTVSATARAAEVLVRDEGGGIPAEDLPHVFDRFYLGQAARVSGERGGTLNLAMAKWLVEKHGGDIQLDSQEGLHTAVRLRLPRQDAEAIPA